MLSVSARPHASARLSYAASGGVVAGMRGRAFYACVTAARVRRGKELSMLKYAIIFAIVSLIAGALGFGGVAAGAAGIAKLLFGLFLVLAIVFLVLAALGVGAVKKALD